MRKAMATRNKTGIRAELFGQMSNWEIVGEVVGGIAFFALLGGFCFGILLLG